MAFFPLKSSASESADAQRSACILCAANIRKHQAVPRPRVPPAPSCVVGGVVPLAILAAVAFIFIRRRRRQAGGTQPQPQIQEASEYWKTQPPTSPILNPTSPSLPYNPYYVSSLVSPSGSSAWGVISLLRRLAFSFLSLEPFGSDDVSASCGRWAQFDDFRDSHISPRGAQAGTVLWRSGAVTRLLFSLGAFRTFRYR